MNASPAKLRDGSWGARVPGEPQTGTQITVRTKGGKSWHAEITRVLWTGTDRSGATVSLCATKSLDRQRAGGRGRGTWTGCSCGSVEEYERNSDCFTCRHDRY